MPWNYLTVSLETVSAASVGGLTCNGVPSCKRQSLCYGASSTYLGLVFANCVVKHGAVMFTSSSWWGILNLYTLGPAHSWCTIFHQRICMLKSPWALGDKVTICLHSVWLFTSKGVIDRSCHIQVIYIFLEMVWNCVSKVQTFPLWFRQSLNSFQIIFCKLVHFVITLRLILQGDAAFDFKVFIKFVFLLKNVIVIWLVFTIRFKWFVNIASFAISSEIKFHWACF